MTFPHATSRTYRPQVLPTVEAACKASLYYLCSPDSAVLQHCGSLGSAVFTTCERSVRSFCPALDDRVSSLSRHHYIFWETCPCIICKAAVPEGSVDSDDYDAERGRTYNPEERRPQNPVSPTNSPVFWRGEGWVLGLLLRQNHHIAAVLSYFPSCRSDARLSSTLYRSSVLRCHCSGNDDSSIRRGCRSRFAPSNRL